jgi:hypothetical protein
VMVNICYKPDAVMASIDVYQDDVRKIIAGTPRAPTVYTQLPFSRSNWQIRYLP